MNADIRRYERINPDTELEIIDIQLDDRGYTSGNRLDTTALDSTSYVGNVIRRRNIFKSWKFRNPIRRIRRQGQRDWRFGLFAGLSASIFVLTCNAGILLYGVLKSDRVHGSIATIVKGNVATTSRISTALHIFINVLSTTLLTSSNYAMQLLCAPTPEEISRAHQTGKWLEIGLMSFRNLRQIEKKRALLWWLLALSSAPLHLFYNSAVFLVTSGKDYSIEAITEQEETTVDPSIWTKLSNSDWTGLYSSGYVSGYSDLLLVINNASSAISVEPDWSASFATSNSSMCDWQRFYNQTIHTYYYNSTADAIMTNATKKYQVEINIPAVLNATTNTFVPNATQNYRVIYELSSSDAYSFNITQNWPKFPMVNASSSYTDALTLCDSDGWIARPSMASLHVKHAHARVRSQISGVQIGIPFLSIVILANIFKVIGLYFALRICSSGHVITVGDAVATFLKIPEADTEKKCILSQRQVLQGDGVHQPQHWTVRTKGTMSIIGGKRLGTAANFILGTSLATLALTLTLMKTGGQSGWGTASKFIISATSTSFDAKGAFLVAFLANLPQAALSFFYFSVNRICTSICFAREWNSFALTRKSLRVTAPSGEQRSTHFLQLPLRWAIPLTAMSGALHYLLSQTLFLVRQEKWTYDGSLYPDSTCACGYSPLSLVVFSAVFFSMIGTVGLLLMRRVDIHLPPARHCSLVISAACHPPAGDVDCHLKPLQWGVVAEATKTGPGHCTFTSRDVQKPLEGDLYE